MVYPLLHLRLRRFIISKCYNISVLPYNLQFKCSYTDIIKNFRQKCISLETNYTHSEYIGLLNEVKNVNDCKTKNDLELDFRNLTNKTLSETENAEQLLTLLNHFVELNWRSSARDLLPLIIGQLDDSDIENATLSNQISYSIKVFELLSQIKLLDNQLIDYIIKNVSYVVDSDFAKLVLSVSVYGLRTKHILDTLYQECITRSGSFNISDAMIIIRGLSDFATDYKDFFKLQAQNLSQNVQRLTDDDRKLLLNMCRALHHDSSFEPLKDSISKYLLENVDNYDIEYLISVIPYLSRGSKSNSSRALACLSLIKLFNDESKLQNCTIEQLSNILESVSWWKIRSNLINRILSLLSTRINEVRNAKNLGLFVDIYNSINSMSWFHHPFMLSSAQFVKDPHLMSRISPLQFTRILQTFNKIRYYDRESYESMLEYISSEFTALSTRVNQLSDVLLAAADANVKADSFYKKCSAYIYEFFKGLDLKITDENLVQHLESRRVWPRDVANLSWSLTVLGYHKTAEFIPLFQLLLSPNIVRKLTSPEVEMVLHSAEACIIECTNIPKLMLIAQDVSQIYNKQLQQIKSDHDAMLAEDSNNDTTSKIYSHNEKRSGPWISRHQSLYSEFHLRGRLRASRQMQNTLKHMGIEDILSRVTPHFSSPNIIDICFSKENKKGIVILGGNFLMRDSSSGDWNYTETGLTILQRRVLSLQHWKIYEIGCSAWAQITSLQERKDLLRKALKYLEIEIPDRHMCDKSKINCD